MKWNYRDRVQQRLLGYTKESWPLTKPVDSEVLRDWHHEIYGTHNSPIDYSLRALEHDGLKFVAYILPPGEGGARKGMCCNGLRYGAEGQYISLPHLPGRFYEESQIE